MIIDENSETMVDICLIFSDIFFCKIKHYLKNIVKGKGKRISKEIVEKCIRQVSFGRNQ